jgi:glycosyltransferase involved in cell wall biosynthesis
MKYKSLSIVFPAYNEEENIEESVRKAVEVAQTLPMESFEVIVVDDGSTDRTGEIADALSAVDGRVKVFHHKPNQGYAKALKTGFTNAESDLIFYTDSDLQFDLKEIKNLLPAIDDYDIVSGFRIYRYDPLTRLFLSWGFNLLVRTIFRIRVRDVDCAFKLFRKSVFDKVTIKTRDFFVDSEILAKARKEGFTMTEIGVRHYPRRAGRSTVRASHIMKTLRELAKIWAEIYLGVKR